MGPASYPKKPAIEHLTIRSSFDTFQKKQGGSMEKILTGSRSKAVRIFDIGHPEVLERIARDMKFRAEDCNPGEMITHEIVEGLILCYNPAQKSIDMIVPRAQAAAATAPAGHS
jgi:hypothetical protein